MGELVNLRRVRKAKQREAAAKQAQENRARSGASKAERAAASEREKAVDRALDGARIELPPNRAS